jgi:hypothetical protein
MRKMLIPTMALLMLAGCSRDSASYYVDGREHALTVTRVQEYFWSDHMTVSLIVARLPDCQRRHMLAPVSDSGIDVFASAAEVWTLRSGAALWRIDGSTCELINAASAGALGARVGSFTVRDKKLRFEAAQPGTPAR